LYQGHLAEARIQLEKGLSLYDAESHAAHAFTYGQDPSVAGLSYLGFTLALQGHESEALACIDRALRRAEVLGHTFSRAVALHLAAVTHELRADFQSLLTYAEQTIALATEHRFPFWLAGGIRMRGRALAAQGRHADGLALMLQGMGIWRATGAGLSVAYYLGLIAEVYRAAGDTERGLAAVAEGLAAAERNEEYFFVPELDRIQGELLAADPATRGEAEECFQRAVSLAREQGSRVLARRAAASFATYLRAHGRVAEADQVLHELDAASADDSAA
jgi:adenylate cyclase